MMRAQVVTTPSENVDEAFAGRYRYFSLCLGNFTQAVKSVSQAHGTSY